LLKVLEALAVSPLLGFVLAGALYFLCRKRLHDEHLYRPVTDKPPIWWMRGILILTCFGVSFSHGTNDGQKSIGLIMLVIIGIFPATYALNPAAKTSVQDTAHAMRQARPLIQRFGDDHATGALAALGSIENRPQPFPGSEQPKLEVGPRSARTQTRSTIRDHTYQVISELKHVEEARGIHGGIRSRASVWDALAHPDGMAADAAGHDPNRRRTLLFSRQPKILSVGFVCRHRDIIPRHELSSALQRRRSGSDSVART
jgi:PiT family inorganic phosphate transporter